MKMTHLLLQMVRASRALRFKNDFSYTTPVLFSMKGKRLAS